MEPRVRLPVIRDENESSTGVRTRRSVLLLGAGAVVFGACADGFITPGLDPPGDDAASPDPDAGTDPGNPDDGTTDPMDSGTAPPPDDSGTTPPVDAGRPP